MNCRKVHPELNIDLKMVYQRHSQYTLALKKQQKLLTLFNFNKHLKKIGEVGGKAIFKLYQHSRFTTRTNLFFPLFFQNLGQL